MKFVLGIAAAVAGVVLAGSAMAGPDDAKWVARCVSDNANAKVSVEVVTSYCTCMNNEMDNNETRTVSVWEQTPEGKVAMGKCDKASGWNKN